MAETKQGSEPVSKDTVVEVAKLAHSQLDEIPGAESTQAITQRARLLLSEVTKRHAGARVLAVSHGALIRFVLSEVTDGKVPPKGERLENASLHVLRAQKSWTLDAWAPKPLGSS